MIEAVVFGILMIIIGYNFNDFKQKFFLTKTKLLIVYIGIATVVIILEGYIWPLNPEYFKDQWYYSKMYGIRSDGVKENISMMFILIGPIIILIVDYLRRKTVGLKRN